MAKEKQQDEVAAEDGPKMFEVPEAFLQNVVQIVDAAASRGAIPGNELGSWSVIRQFAVELLQSS